MYYTHKEMQSELSISGFNVSVLSTCMFAQHMCLVYMEVKGELPISWNWSCRWLWVLGIETLSSKKVQQVLLTAGPLLQPIVRYVVMGL